MNTAANSGKSPTAHSDWLRVQGSLSRPQQLAVLLSKIAQRDDKGHAQTLFLCIMFYNPHLEHRKIEAEHDDTGHALTPFKFFLVHHTF